MLEWPDKQMQGRKGEKSYPRGLGLLRVWTCWEELDEQRLLHLGGYISTWIARLVGNTEW